MRRSITNRSVTNRSVPYKSVEPQRTHRWWFTAVRSVFCLLIGMLLLGSKSTHAQFGNGTGNNDNRQQANRTNTGNGIPFSSVEPAGKYPPSQYYLGLQAYRAGDLKLAFELFDASVTGARLDPQGRYIEAIPGLAMSGECYWQMGDLPSCRQKIDQIIQILRRHKFLRGVDWRNAIQPGVAVSKRAFLWPDAAAVRVASFRDTLPVASGQQVTPDVLRQGGVIESLTYLNMDVAEIMRGIAIASYRRRVLMGPLSGSDPGANLLLDSIKYPVVMPPQIGKTMIGSARSVGYFGKRDDQRMINDALSVGFYGGTVHPLSAITMLAATNALVGSKKPETAIPAAMKTVHISAALGQLEFIGEAFQLAAGSANTQQAAVLAESASLIGGRLLRESRFATLHCLIAGADAAVTAGNLEMASKLLVNAEAVSNRRDVTLPRFNAYASYVRSRLAAASGSTITGTQSSALDKALVPMLTFALNTRNRRQVLVSMPRVYQFNLIQQAIGNSRADSAITKLLESYCVDPPVEVWRRDPVDGLAAAMIDTTAAQVSRVNLAAATGYGEKLLQAIDGMLAARFHRQLPLGGRIAQVRAIAKADEKDLPPAIAEMRNAPGNPISEVRKAAAIAGKPTLAAMTTAETKACVAALSRIHLPQVTLPTLEKKAPAAKLPPKTGLLTFTYVGKRVYATLSAKNKIVMWTVNGSSRVPAEIGKLLRGIGVGRTRGNRIPEDDSWKEDAVALRRLLIPEDTTITAEKFDELIIVPDGPLWYLPFDLLPFLEADSPLFGEQCKIRYAATPALALRPASASPASNKVGIATGKFFAPRDLELNQEIVDSIVDVVTDPLRLPDANMTPTALMGSEIGHLAIAAPQTPNTKNFLLTPMAPYEQNYPLGNLAAWLRFPTQVPTNVILAGFRTPVDVGRMGDGSEIFGTLTALNVAGVRNVLISRWAVGGNSTAVLLKEFLQELPFIGMDEAWQRAKLVLLGTNLDPAGEPLLTQAEHELEGLNGKQPLFWSGYMVSSPPKADAPAAAAKN
ncbi:CHAT domain-containing protein [bacterium]|nr:CHAT domain-containing protein [bacterium]